METNFGAVIESLLFVWGEELSFRRLSVLINQPVGEVRRLVDQLAKKYDSEESGIKLMVLQDAVQMTANIDHYDYIEKLGKTSKRRGFSKPTIETLAVIAYKQPVTKTQIEKIRGVKCDKPLQNLLEKQVIGEKGRLETIGKPILYGTTNEFLKLFGFKSMKELPDIQHFEDSEFFLRDDLFNEESENI